VRDGVATGRSNRAEADLALPRVQTSDDLEPRTGRELRGLPRGGPDVGVAVEVAAPGHREGLDGPAVDSGMNEIEHLIGRRKRLHGHEGLTQPGGVDAPLDRFETFRSLRVPVTGVMIEEPVMGRVKHR